MEPLTRDHFDALVAGLSTKGDIKELRTEMRTEIHELRTEMNTKFRCIV